MFRNQIGQGCEGPSRLAALACLVISFGECMFAQRLPVPSAAGKQSCSDCLVRISPALEKGNIIRRAWSRPVIGWLNEKTGTQQLRFDVGIEQWEEGKKDSRVHQLWSFSCSDERALGCSVDRVTVSDWGAMLRSPVVSTQTHDLRDGNLKLNRLDWKQGVLDLTLIFGDGETAEVAVRFDFHDSTYLLRSLKGVSVHRGVFDGELSTVEYRVPTYTYTIDVPLEMKGLSDAGLEQWDALFGSLSDADKSAWEQFDSAAQPSDIDPAGELRERMRKRLPDVDAIAVDKGTRKLTETEQRIMDELVRESIEASFVKWVERAPLSPSAKLQIKSYLRARLAELR